MHRKLSEQYTEKGEKCNKKSAVLKLDQLYMVLHIDGWDHTEDL